MARILFFKLKPSQEILKIRDGTPLEAEEILTYIKSPRNGSVCYFSSKLDILSNVIQKKRVARILFFKIRQSQEILKIRDGTPLEAEEILTYIKALEIDCKLDFPSNVVQKKRVAQILFFKIKPSQEILKIRDGTPLEAEEILTYIKRPSQEILKLRDGTPLEAEKILTYIKALEMDQFVTFLASQMQSQEILKIRDGTPFAAEEILTYIKEIIKIRDGTPLEAGEILTYIKSPRNGSKILKIRDGTPLEAEEIFTYIKSPRNGSVCYFSSKLDILSNVIQKKRVARILFFKIKPSQEILKIRDGTPLELDVPSNVVQKNRVARILFFKIKPSQEILKIRDGTPLGVEEILTYIKSPRNGSVCYFSSKLDILSNVIQKKRVARILFFKIRQSQEILKIRDGTPLEAEEILTYIKSPRNGLLDFPSNVVQKKRVARILFFKIKPSQEILKIRDGTPLELDVPSNVVQKNRVARILFFKIKPSQEILKIRDGTPLEVEEILTYIKSPRNGSVCYFSSKLDILSNVIQKKRVARILFFKIRQSQEILKIRDGTPLEAEEILTYIKSPRNGLVCYFSRKLEFPNNLDFPSNVVQKKRVARILFFKIKPSQEILKIRDGTPLEAEEILTYIKSNVVQKNRVARILFFKIKPSQEILKIRDGTPLEVEEILTYIKSPRNGSVCYFSSKLDILSNVIQKKRVARILFFKIRQSQEILKIRDGTPLEAEEILTYIKSPRNGLVCYFSSKLEFPNNKF
ncbi:hypothetical protein OROMI_006510 [Orobanche minor]